MLKPIYVIGQYQALISLFVNIEKTINFTYFLLMMVKCHCVFPEILTQLLKIIHRICCELFHKGTVLFGKAR